MNIIHKMIVVWAVFIGAALLILPGCSPSDAEKMEYPVSREIPIDSYRKIFEVTIDGCQYLTGYDINGSLSAVTHKGNCKNHSVSRQ